MRAFCGSIALAIAISLLPASSTAAEELYVPVLVPVTGFLALEGTSQRNGAVMALDEASDALTITYEVTDTSTSPEAAVTALERALSRGDANAVVAPMLGTQMLALLPLAADYEVPLITISGTAAITEQGNPWIFRFFPGDAVVKVAHARYAAEDVGITQAAILYQTTAYGQSGHQHLVSVFEEIGVDIVHEEGLATDVREMLPVLTKVAQSGADGLILHLHSGPTAMVVRQARAMGLDIPIIAGSAMAQPATAALLEPEELADVCAESGSSPISGGSPELEQWVADYRSRFDDVPDAFALGQYDATRMVLAAAADGATTTDGVRDWLAEHRFEGLAMPYKSDGAGNMAHDAVIVCYDGVSRTPEVVRRFANIDGVL